MCGITGYFSNSTAISGDLFYKAHKLIRHRGPNDEGFSIINENSEIIPYKGDDTIDFYQNKPHISTLFSSKCIFGHRRLSILDLSENGHQPIISEDRTCMMVYNGEVYNYLDIKTELIKKGYKFYSNSDTEVVLNSYMEWGENCFSRFNGMWALAIYDLKKKKIILSRDRFGIKPLYYSYQNGIFCFGSEIKFIRAVHPFFNTINEHTVYKYINSCHLNTNEDTFFKGIKELEPAHTLIFERSKICMKKYWDFKPQQKISNIEEATDTFVNLFEDAVKLRLQSDVEVGSLLSGGLDSNLIIGIMKKLGYNPNSFSAVFENEEFSEMAYIERSIKKYNLKSHFIWPTAENLKSDLSDLIYYMEEPFRSFASYSGYCIYRYMQKTPIKVVLNGQGADELFGGYTYDYYIFFAELLSKGFFKKFLHEYRLFSKKRNASFKQSLKPMIKLFPFALKDSNFFANYCLSEIQKTPLREYLRYEDRNSMAFSIEARVPFLDYRIVEFALSLSSNLKINNFINKRIERIGAKGLVDDSIIGREDKMGFVSPQEIWQKTEFKSELDNAFLVDRLSAIKSIPVSPLLKAYDNYVSHKNDNWGLIWRIFCLYKWEECLTNK